MKTKKFPKYLFVSGGVISGLGKGITAASIGLLLKSAGYKISVLKADMYLNVDAGTMNPLEHGEVFVTEDGLETDQDLGHYERFLNQDFTKSSYVTMGQIYWEVLNKERALEYEGKCVEGNIHIPKQIIDKIKTSAKESKADFLIIEIGGTIGEYQNIMFYEAVRRMYQENPSNVMLVHVVYLPIPSFLGEMKSKPAQSSIYDLYGLGLHPTFVVCRSEKKVDDKRRKTMAFNTGVKAENIISAEDVDSIYKVPVLLAEQDMSKKILEEFNLKPREKDLKEWKNLIKTIDKEKKDIKIAIAGKYFSSGNFSLEDSYVCVIEAIKHAAWKHGLNPVIKWFDVEEFEKNIDEEKLVKKLSDYDGIIVPQGWGKRGVEGKLKVVKIARENKIPYLGLCFGMQMATIEFARTVCKLRGANSEEVNPETKFPVIHIMKDQKKILESKKYGATIRLGAWPCKLKKGTILRDAYEKYGPDRLQDGRIVQERHRHRYEFNNKYKLKLEKEGFVISGTSPDGKLVEAIELDRSVHPFFVGTQYHPEYKSRPLSPHPIFMAFIEAAKR
jgi:CTP synthase